MLAPDGSPGWVPHDKVSDALKDGAQLGIAMLAPDKSTGVVPLSRAHEALADGAQIIGGTSPGTAPAQLQPQAEKPVSRFQQAVIGSEAFKPTLQQAAAIQDPTLRGQALQQQFRQDVQPIVRSAQIAGGLQALPGAVGQLGQLGRAVMQTPMMQSPLARAATTGITTGLSMELARAPAEAVKKLWKSISDSL